MKLNKYTWIFVGLIVAVYLGTLLWVRVTNPVYLQQNMYRTWEKSYVIHPRADQSFVNTSTNNNHQKPIALSESQGYGMWITIMAAKKAGRVGRILIALSTIGWRIVITLAISTRRRLI